VKLLNGEHVGTGAEVGAAALMETMPLLIRKIREEGDTSLPGDLTVPQFRTLMYIERHPGTPLSPIGDHLGLTVSSISKIVEALVQRGDVRHTVSRADRRRARLALTRQGVETITTGRAATQRHLAGLLSTLTEAECATVVAALRCLHQACRPATAEPNLTPNPSAAMALRGKE
jgi:DNA-binding MarR family transcriptional regulator